MNGSDRLSFDDYLARLTKTIVESAAPIVQSHADRCYDQHLKPINEKLERQDEKLDKLLVASIIQRGSQKAQDVRQDAQDARMKEDRATQTLPEKFTRKVWVMWGVGIFLAGSVAAAFVSCLVQKLFGF